MMTKFSRPLMRHLTVAVIGLLLFHAGCNARKDGSAEAGTPSPSPSEAVDKLAAIPALAGYKGTYAITEVLEGMHERKEVTIAPDGSIDFDKDIKLGKDHYTLAEDKRAANGCIVVELNKQDGKIARLDILFDPESKGLRAMRYLPDASSAEGLVEVEF